MMYPDSAFLMKRKESQYSPIMLMTDTSALVFSRSTLQAQQMFQIDAPLLPLQQSWILRMAQVNTKTTPERILLKSKWFRIASQTIARGEVRQSSPQLFIQGGNTSLLTFDIKLEFQAIPRGLAIRMKQGVMLRQETAGKSQFFSYTNNVIRVEQIPGTSTALYILCLIKYNYYMKCIATIFLSLALVTLLQAACTNPLLPYAYGPNCYGKCPWSPSAITYLDVSTATCVPSCPPTYFADDLSRTCTTSCPTSPILTFYDLVNQVCRQACASDPISFAYLATNTCVDYCPSPLFGEENSQTCVSACPTLKYYQVSGSLRICVARCYPNYYADGYGYCVSALGCTNSTVQYYADDSTNLCVKKCPSGQNTFGDSTSGRCLLACPTNSYADPTTQNCVTICPETPPYFGSSITLNCLTYCNQGEFADNLTRLCLARCPSGFFGDYSTRACLVDCPFSQATFADPLTSLCITVCSPNYYADNATRSCVLPIACTGDTVGNPTLGTCVDPLLCPTAYFVDETRKLCVLRCSSSWGNFDSRYCEPVCPWNPPLYYTYKDASTNTCVVTCPFNPRSFSDPTTQSCVAQCPAGYFGTTLTYACVQTCPDGYFSDLSTFLCISNCTSTATTILYFYQTNMSCIAACPPPYFADNTTLTCVLRCPTDFYGYSSRCLSLCPPGYFGDTYSQQCVPACPEQTGQYADISSNLCVSICPANPDLYGEDLNNGNRSCVSTCQHGLFADPLTRICQPVCDTTAGYFGYTSDHRCHLRCPTGYGDPIGGECVSVCPSFTFGDNITAQCVETCPKQTYGDSSNLLCVTALACSNSQFGDDSTGRCVPLCSPYLHLFGDSITGKCASVCTFPNYADNATQLCSAACTAQQFRDPSTLRCVRYCPSLPDLYADPNTMKCESSCTNNYFAYNGVYRVCVAMCPSTPSYFADQQAMRCVSSCANETYKFVNNSFRGCLKTCPPQVYTNTYSIVLYADNSSWSCVVVCPQSTYGLLLDSDSRTRKCLKDCMLVGGVYYFADDSTRKCVTACPLFTLGMYGDTISLKCVTTCSLQQFRDNTTLQCAYTCSPGFFADNTTYNCLKVCPRGTFAESINRTCVKQCPNPYYGYNATCLLTCPTSTLYYNDNTTWNCLDTCPLSPDYYIDQQLQACVLLCSIDTYADPQTRMCLPAINCSMLLHADPLSRRCVETCSIMPMHFLDPLTNICGPLCDQPLFADNTTNECVEMCPAPYLHVNTTGNFYCTQFCPANYYIYTNASEGLSWCVLACPSGLMADNLTWTCVAVCPDKYYAMPSNLTCMLSCAPLYKDDTTKSCMASCPSGYTANNNNYMCQTQCDFGEFSLNRVCIPTCPPNLFADGLSRKCLPSCPADTLTYADNTTHQCIFLCSPLTYAYLGNETCLPQCPVSYFRELTLRVCLAQCLYGQYADPQSLNCLPDCTTSTYSFADPTSQSCVLVCPFDLFGYLNECLTRCPNGYYAQNYTRRCVAVCPNVSAVVLVAGFGDNRTNRCLSVCTGLTYAYLPLNLCLATCPNSYASDLLKSCVNECPPTTFSLGTTWQCVTICPPAMWADLVLRTCRLDCAHNASLYADNSTNKCVDACPTLPDLFADSTNQMCVLTCSAGLYASNVTRSCVAHCMPPFFADPSSSVCVLTCPIYTLTYADSQLRKCMAVCTNYSVNGTTVIYYSDNSTASCVTQCPQIPERLYGYENQCLSSCIPNTYGDNDTRLCLHSCIFAFPKFTWMDRTSWFCVTVCPFDYFADNHTGYCEPTCSWGTYADTSSRRCVFNCPNNPQAYGLITAGNLTVCVYDCPSGLFADEISITCAATCPTTPFFYFTYTPTNKCVKSCIFPYFGVISSQSCNAQCQQGFYGNLTTTLCEACQTQCVTCIAFLKCLSCVPGFYLYQYACVLACPTYPVLYFAHIQSGVCFMQCPIPYFGEATTKQCQLSCPVTYYANVNTRICTACPIGCLSCSAFGCQSCFPLYLFLAWNMSCNAYCNSTAIYAYSTACYTQCPEGTYLTSTLVSCLACSTQCLTCVGIAGNCTRCNGKMYYLGACVDACPADFYANNVLSCLPCTPQACALPPLSYKISTFTSDYKLNAYVVFNRPVTITVADFIRIVQIKYNGQAVLPSQYTATLFNTTTYRVVFTDAGSLNQNSITFAFSPGSITDAFGNILTVSSLTSPVTVNTGVNASVASTSSFVSSTTQILAWILLAGILLFLIKSAYPVLIAIQTVQLLYMHTFLRINPIPYMQYKFLDALKYLHFLFLPHLFAGVGISDVDYYIFLSDSSYLYNCSPFLIILLLVLLIYFFVWVLSSKKACAGKAVRKIAKKVRKYRLKYNIIFEAFWITMPYALFFSLLQFTQATFTSPSGILNVLLSIATFLVFLGFTVFVVYLGYKYRSMESKIPRKYCFLMLQESKFPLQITLRVIRKFLFCLGLLLPSVLGQVGVIMMVNAVFLVYITCFRPAKSPLTNALNITVEVCYLVLEGLYIGYSKMISPNINAQMGFAYAMISVEATSVVIVLLWLCYRLALALKETDIWRQIVAKVTKNTDPEYLKSQQRRRDLEFDFGQIEQRTQGEQSTRKQLTTEKYNVFDAPQEKDHDLKSIRSESSRAEEKSRPLSMESSEHVSPLVKQVRVPGQVSAQGRRARGNFMMMRDLDPKNDLHSLEGSKGHLEDSKVQLGRGVKRALWEDIELDENQI